MCVAMAAFTLFGGQSVWDATKDGRLMTETNDIVLFKGVSLANHRLARCWFNKAGRVRADGTRAMSVGEGNICHVRRTDGGRVLEAQCQVFDCRLTKCVKLRLAQKGNDVVGRVLYARYCTEHGMDRIGENFDTLSRTVQQPAYSVLPTGRVSNGYNVDWLVLTEIGSAEDNIPENIRGGSMSVDAAMLRMENAVDPAVLAVFRKAHPAPFLLFGEDRKYAVRNGIVPAHWFRKDSRAAQVFCGEAQPGEFYPFQVCVVSEKARKLRWSANTGLKVNRITPETCEVAANGVKPIWVMVDVPKDAAGRTLKGEVRVEDPTDATSATLPFEIEVKGAVLKDGGISDAWRLARLKWLNSSIGRENAVTKPYTPVTVDAASRTVRILGRELVLGEDGLPAQIVSYFNGSNTRILEKGMNLLARPVSFKTDRTPSKPGSFAFTETMPTHASWRVETGLGGGAKRILEGRVEFTGECRFRIRHEGIRAASASFELAMPSEVARFREGFGINGGFFPAGKVEQKWDAALNRDAMWMGSINGGLVVRFKGANYRRPLINAYYAWQKLRMPESWASGDGIMSLEKNVGVATVRAEGRDAPEGAEWNFDLYITPFHRLDMKTHLGDRYWHLSQRKSSFDAKKIREAGATVVNLHHNTIWNPYINYPYNDDSSPLLKKAVADAHATGLKLKVYYTTRELTQNLPEFFALKSLDGEALLKRDKSVPGWPCTNRNGPHPWLREHVGMDILPAWRENVRFPQAYKPRLDLAVITTPDTRWDNFYLEGLDYLVREYGIDGLYIDDTALTGESMQRARRILDRDGKRRLVDNHSWNHHDRRAGSGNTNLAFIDLYPYFDLLWRGEGFYNNTPSDFWLIERSGIAFGIAGEMLGRGNPFRGLLFGMTDRAGWGGTPAGLWKFFDEVKLGDMELVGWWDDACPVKVSGSDDVKASVWKGHGVAVLVIANFAQKPRSASFAFDSRGLGLDAAKTVWRQPSIGGVQDAGPVPDLSKPIEIPAEGGFILSVGK
ncbi:MAG: hypothetical protein J6Z49_00830 [Kiritimatiellae bacterium]|nr:hypothetical protein [Kiritimatiellia bacterium]